MGYPYDETETTIWAVFFLGAWVLYTKLGYLRNAYAGLRHGKGSLRESLHTKFVLCKRNAQSL